MKVDHGNPTSMEAEINNAECRIFDGWEESSEKEGDGEDNRSSDDCLFQGSQWIRVLGDLEMNEKFNVWGI